jgi:glycine cleavage system H lipoate-binding protein
MAAGLVAYKICDRALECETCPFDAALRGAVSDAPSPSPEAEAGANPWSFPEGRRFHPAHTWAEWRSADRFRIGIDAFAAGLVGRPLAVVLSPPGSPVAQGHPGCWLVDESGPIPLRMPLSGTVVRGNECVQALPGLASESPYGSGWLLEMDCPTSGTELERLHAPAEMRRRAGADRERFLAQARTLVRRTRPAVGPTLCDGGEPLTHLRDLLGRAAYRRLVLQALYAGSGDLGRSRWHTS